MSIDESSLLIEIENYIVKISNCRKKPKEFYNSLARSLIDFDEIYNSSYSYFGCIEAYIDLLHELEHYLYSEHLLIYQLENISFEIMQRRFKYYVIKHNRKLRDHRYSERLNSQNLADRLKLIVKKYKRTLVVRLDLGYKKKDHNQITIADFINDMQELRHYIHQRDDKFADLIEYAWALEQGHGKGYHCHLLLVYRGHEHHKPYGIVKAIGELWSDITANQGCYFNCHDPDYLQQFEDMDRLGIGMIYRDDPVQVKKMLQTVKYLVRPEKEDQHLRVKISKKMKTFGISQRRS